MTAQDRPSDLYFRLVWGVVIFVNVSAVGAGVYMTSRAVSGTAPSAGWQGIVGTLALLVPATWTWLNYIQSALREADRNEELESHKKELKEAEVVQYHPAGAEGEDLKTMLQYYKNCNELTIFSGDFDWILKNDDLYARFVELANKNTLHLVSYKNPGDIESGWKDTGTASRKPWREDLSKLRGTFRFRKKEKNEPVPKDETFKFSLVKYDDNRYSFLSLISGGATGDNTNIGVHDNKNDAAKKLVNIVEKLSKIARRNSTPWEESGSDDAKV